MLENQFRAIRDLTDELEVEARSLRETGSCVGPGACMDVDRAATLCPRRSVRDTSAATHVLERQKSPEFSVGITRKGEDR